MVRDRRVPVKRDPGGAGLHREDAYAWSGGGSY